MPNKAAVALAAAALCLLAGACGGSSAPPKADAETLLQQAKATVDAAQSAHFVITTEGATGGGTSITGGEGDLARPDQLQGTFTVSLHGLTANVKVVSKGGVFAAQLPFTSKYTRTNPTAFGLTDPAQLLNPSHGLSNLLTAGTNAKVTGQERVKGELLYEVTSTVPGSAIPVLPDAHPSQPVTMVTAINPTNHEVRQLALTGPFSSSSSSSDSTYAVTLTNYNEPVTITLPPA